MSYIDLQKRGRVASLTIKREEALNALNQKLLLELRKTLLELDSCSVLVITGAGEKAFVAGADIKAMQAMSPMEAAAFSELGQGLIQMIEQAPYISIAAVNGFALGGGLELALACDLIYCSDNANFGLPETNLGIIPGFGGTINLMNRVGYHSAMEMILRGHMINAEQAKEKGLVLDVFSRQELMEKVNEHAEYLANKGVYSLLAAKRLVRSGVGSDRNRAFHLERESFATLFSSGEPQEGMSAFVEKRKPNFYKKM